jgi:hypothetical protein
MANPVVLPRALLIYAITIPLALVTGFLLTTPLELPSFFSLIFVAFMLLVPVLIRVHHQFLLLAWNAPIVIFFLPGRPALWMLAALLGITFILVNRILDRSLRYNHATQVTASLLFLLAVILVTAKLRGGLGMRSMGDASYGGKNYAYLLAAVVGYFALSLVPIPARRARLAVALFYLPGLLAIVGHLIIFAGPSLYWLFNFFATDAAISQLTSEEARQGFLRLPGVSQTCMFLSWFLLARYGLCGILDLKRPWRLALFLGLFVLSMAGGFRSVLAWYFVVVAIQFFLEGLHRTIWLPVSLALGLLGLALLFPLAPHLPHSLQRTVSFLPVEVDAAVRADAEGSTEWRVRMWKYLLPELPKYVFLGKGYAIDPNDIYFAQFSGRSGSGEDFEGSMVAGDYHSGPLSVFIPLGGPGFVAFLLFLAASLRVLYLNYRNGEPGLMTINTFLFAYFLAHTLLFFSVFGGLTTSFYLFAGNIGLSVALNGGVRTRPAPAQAGG